jgi:hypothetical protein
MEIPEMLIKLLLLAVLLGSIVAGAERPDWTGVIKRKIS